MNDFDSISVNSNLLAFYLFQVLLLLTKLLYILRYFVYVAKSEFNEIYDRSPTRGSRWCGSRSNNTGEN